MTELISRRLEIDALRALWAIHIAGGITRAAETLGLTQSAVSHKIRRLEMSLDCQILSRKPDAPLFTAAGEDLLSYAERIVGLHDEALLNLSKAPLSGKLSLGLTEDTTCTDLARILGRFRRRYADVSVRMQVRMSLVLRAMLEQGELDAAVLLVFAHEVRPSDRVLMREELHWVKSPDLELPDDRPIPFLSFDEHCFYRRWALDMGRDNGTTFEVVFDCSSSAGIAAAVTAGLGVAIVNQRHITPGMEIIRHRLPKPPGIAYVVRRARRTRNEPLDALIAEIEAGLGAERTLRLAKG